MVDFTYENIGFGLVEFTPVSDRAIEHVSSRESIAVGFDEADAVATLILIEGFTLVESYGERDVA